MMRPSAIACDVGDTLLREVRFDLEAGIRAALPGPRRDYAVRFAHAFRDELREVHASHRELMLSNWLRHHVPELQEAEEAQIEDAVWSEVVTLLPVEGVGVLLAECVTTA